jgi:DNA-binding NarL/FixJ family response regulator
MARHARAVAGGTADDLLAVADGFDALDLAVYAAEATAVALDRLRRQRSVAAGGARERLAALLGRCDLIRTPALQAGSPALTEREWQVARLAADGVTSRVIAERLYLSSRTVENHLQRIYSKLGVTGRAELRAALRAIPGHEGGESE